MPYVPRALYNTLKLTQPRENEKMRKCWNLLVVVTSFHPACCFLSSSLPNRKFSVMPTSTTWLKRSRMTANDSIKEFIALEESRQRSSIELIASENYVSRDVLECLGSCLTNKYSEGLPGSRYYGGNECIDMIERECLKRALDLFSLNANEWTVNVQPYSGSPANFAVYLALLRPGDTILSLGLSSGGHLSHGHHTTKKNISAASQFYRCMSYGVNERTGLVDYDELESLATEYKPALIIAGASTYSRDWDYPRMRRVADRCGSLLMADMAHFAGFVAHNMCSSPFPYCDVVTTTTHKSLRGPRSGLIFSRMAWAARINDAVFPGLQGGPHDHQVAAVAVALAEAKSKDFGDYLAQVKRNAQELCSQLMALGYTIVTNGTDNHQFLWDVRSTGLSGRRIEEVLGKAGISVNRNVIRGDTSARHPHGVRIGSLAVTSRGMKETEMGRIAGWIHECVEIAANTATPSDNAMQEASMSLNRQETELSRIKSEISQFASSFLHPSLKNIT